MEPDKFENNENIEIPEDEIIASEETQEDEADSVCDLCIDEEGQILEQMADGSHDEFEVDAEDSVSEELTQEELDEMLAYKKRRHKKSLIITLAVLAIIAVAAFMVCAVEGVGEDTVVNHPVTTYEDQAEGPLNSLFHTDNIRYQSPIVAFFNSLTGKNKDIAMFINGEAVALDVFDFVSYSSAINCAYTMLQSGMVSDVSQIDWEEIEKTSGLSYSELAKGMAVDTLSPIYALVSKAGEFGVEFTEEDEAKVKAQIDGLKEKYGDSFETALKSSGYESEETLARIQRLNLYSTKICEAIDGKLEEYLSETEIKSLLSDDKVSVRHILIQFEADENGNVTDEAKTKALNKAKEVLEKIKSGEDFDKLVKEYDSDTAQPEEGYTFANDGTMVQEFADAAFALDIGGVSEPVETVYGYHIIKRNEQKIALEDYLALLRRTADVRINKSVYDSVKASIDLGVPETKESETKTAE